MKKKFLSPFCTSMKVAQARPLAPGFVEHMQCQGSYRRVAPASQEYAAGGVKGGEVG